MRGEHLLEKLSFIDHKWVKEAETEKKNNHKLRRVMTSAVAAVAALAVVAGAAMEVFLNSQAFVLQELARDSEQVQHLRFCIVESHLAEYEVKKLTDRQQEKLADMKGELYLEGEGLRIYRFADREDLVYLIFESDDALILGEFWQFHYNASYDTLREWVHDPDWASVFPFPQEQLEKIVPVSSPLEIFRIIYGLESAEDIQAVTFKKTIADRSIKIKTVTLRDKRKISEFFNILISLDVPEDDYWSDDEVKQEYKERKKQFQTQNIPLWQINRTIIITLDSGYELEMSYDGIGERLNCVSVFRVPLNEEQNNWIIEHAEIDFTPRDYAESPTVKTDGMETATPTPVPSDTAEAETAPTPE